jgi:hypothetical protein
MRGRRQAALCKAKVPGQNEGIGRLTWWLQADLYGCKSQLAIRKTEHCNAPAINRMAGQKMVVDYIQSTTEEWMRKRKLT